MCTNLGNFCASVSRLPAYCNTPENNKITQWTSCFHLPFFPLMLPSFPLPLFFPFLPPLHFPFTSLLSFRYADRTSGGALSAPQWGLGQSFSRQTIWSIFVLKEQLYWQQFFWGDFAKKDVIFCTAKTKRDTICTTVFLFVNRYSFLITLNLSE